MLAQTFSTNSTLDHSGAVLPSPTRYDFLMPIIQITSKDVHAVLSGLDTKKAHGSDGVPPVVLKNCASELTPCLGKLFRLCLSSNTFPSSWKFALIQPVPKKGDRSLPSNYRPIALTSTISKIPQSVINKIFLIIFLHTICSLTGSMDS